MATTSIRCEPRENLLNSPYDDNTAIHYGELHVEYNGLEFAPPDCPANQSEGYS
jgi:hypothetical protein